MGYMLMQPDDSNDSKIASSTLIEDTDNAFVQTLSGTRLQPVLFGSRHCTTKESHFHSFIGEAACSRWAIAHLCKYLWGAHFYWVTDCIALRKFLEYDGSIHQVKHWAQELLGYFFTIIHRPAFMMRDVDAISQFYDPLIQRYDMQAAQFLKDTKTQQPRSFTMISIDSLTKSLSPSDDFIDPPITVNPKSCTTFTCTPPRFHYPSSELADPRHDDVPQQPDHTIPSLDTPTAIMTTAHSTSWISINGLLSPIAHHISQATPPI